MVTNTLFMCGEAKKLEKSHDPPALVAHTGSSSRTSSPYYVTHPSSVVDYDDDYQGDTVQNNSDDPLTSAIIILARDRVNIQSKNSGNDGRNTRHLDVQKEVIESNNIQNDAGNIQRTLRTVSSGTVSNVQCYNCNEKGHYARNCPKPRSSVGNYTFLT
ncbi:gag-pol polyprotein [Tanacetum coccineum]